MSHHPVVKIEDGDKDYDNDDLEDCENTYDGVELLK